MSAPTNRVIQILNLLAETSEAPLSGAQIARRLEISRATCHSIVNTLVEADYLSRDPSTKRYSLGHALVRLGNAAGRAAPLLAYAHREMQHLSDSLGLVCSATVRRGEMVIVADQTAPAGAQADGRVGQQVPYLPPFGEVFAAWASSNERTEWLQRGTGNGRATRSRRLAAVLADVRGRGYTVQRFSETSVRLGFATAELAAGLQSKRARSMVKELMAELEHRDYLDEELADPGPYPVAVISAPVFDETGRVALGLALWLQRDLMSDAIGSYGNRLVASASAIRAAAFPRSGGSVAVDDDTANRLPEDRRHSV